jgi:photosystem II stability/assembly factor-like uncharacterized protein
MKRTIIFLLAFVLIGAGCTGSSSQGVNDGGVLKSVNSGLEWSQSNLVPTAAGIGTLSTSNIINMEMDPQDPTYLYVSTRESGMLYSKDSGVSWSQPEEPVLKTGAVFDVEVDPKDICTVYVAKVNRLFKTSDCMRTFNPEMYVDSRQGVNVIRVTVDWYNPKVVWIGLSNGDILKSADSGKTWRSSLKAREEISEIIVSNSDSRQVIVTTFNGNMYRTTNAGAKWEDLKEGLSAFKSNKKIHALVQDQKSKNLFAATDYGILRSNDFGTKWTALNLLTSPGQVKIKAIGLDSSNSNTIYYATRGTFYYSDDSGSTWETEKLPSTREPRSILVDPNKSAVLYIGVAQIID